ncbi:MAG: dihydroorotate dehydrogenase-like protein [Phycisphaerae bacterium]|nr:dihydroorotate dehydrogenase-like protein [Phycisphaerae bacterium]MCZ2399339.1 dihydroorotate dehydrogenase-like protein [Phycisphaerae bacterium]NUQ48412.1 dihydroorotate dehydrogenase-like protein [Phycisphaerae bacterium]
MDLSTTYMGLRLRNPLIAAASPLTSNVDSIRRLEDAGVAAVVLHSLFEEQIEHEAAELEHYMALGTESYAESTSYFPEPFEFRTGPDDYIELIDAAKRAVRIPVIASLNGTSVGGWIHHARRAQLAGADGLELNVYHVATDPDTPGAEIEERCIEIARLVKAEVNIPIAVKLSPYFSSLAEMARRLDNAGVDALVLFNRFYQPDIDLETLEVVPNLVLSYPHELRLPLRWIAALHGRIRPSLAGTSGVQNGRDVLKLLLAGADAVQVAGVLIRHGAEHAATMLSEMQVWMAEKEYASVGELRGAVSQKSCANPAAFERANYMRALATYA